MNGEEEQERNLDIVVPSGFIVLCDMDGTLVDTDYANYLSYRRAISEETHGVHDLHFSGERLNRQGLRKEISSLTDEQCENISDLKSEYFKDFLAETRLNTLLADYLRTIAASTEIVLVTNCRERRAVETLNYHGVLDLFTHRIFRKDGSSNKYERALALMAHDPSKVIAFENEPDDIENAVLAGVPRGNIISPAFVTTVSAP